MSTFRFKQFEVRNEMSAMKVNTDGVLLGICAPLKPSDSAILDIGTGTGTIALILAQRLSDTRRQDSAPAAITGIDIDAPAAGEAESNFSASPWPEMLEARHIGLSGLDAEAPDARFDLVVSNPPYYDSSLTNPDSRKTAARHTGDSETPDGLSFREVLDFAERHLKEGGRVAVVLPAEQEAALARHGRMLGLHISEILRIRTVERKQPSRMVVAFTKEKAPAVERMLTIMESGHYTEQYLALTHDFYLFA